MPKVPIGSAEVGMLLAEPVMNARGQLLAKAGLAITEATLKAFAAAGVTAIEIVDPAERAAALEEALKSLGDRFSRVQEDPMMVAMRDRIETKYRAGWLE
ncbi:MAG: hypothetical protein KC466_09330 [Myxococcales bacterium]|nr:hypothetical protein [Myxococcales bacterium]